MSRIIQRRRSNFIVNERQKLLVELFVLKWAKAVVATSTEQRSPVISQFCFHVSVAQRRYFETIQIEAYFLQQMNTPSIFSLSKTTGYKTK